MKRSAVWGVVVLLTLISCRKNYQCTCTSVFTGGNYIAYADTKSTKKEAQTWCANMQNVSPQPGVVTTCTLN